MMNIFKRINFKKDKEELDNLIHHFNNDAYYICFIISRKFDSKFERLFKEGKNELKKDAEYKYYLISEKQYDNALRKVTEDYKLIIDKIKYIYSEYNKRFCADTDMFYKYIGIINLSDEKGPSTIEFYYTIDIRKIHTGMITITINDIKEINLFVLDDDVQD